MKNILGLILISMFFFKCKKDDDSTIPSPSQNEIELISISIPNGFYLNNSNETSTGQIFLTDNNGEIIADSQLTNNSLTILSRDFDVINNEYNATFLNKYKINDITFYTINTFINVEPYDLEFIEYTNPNPDNEESNLVINNTGGLLENIIINDNSYSFDYSGANGGTVGMQIRLKDVPDDIYFSFQNENENFRRYLWSENVVGNTFDTIEYNDIPVITNNLEITYPINNSVSTDILASKTGSFNKYHRLSRFSDNTGATISNHQYPDNLFQQYRVKTCLTNDVATFTKLEVNSNVNSNFIVPNLGFQIIDNSFDNFEIMSSSDFDYYSVSLDYIDTDQQYAVYWNIHGVGDQNINFSLPHLEEVIFEDHPNFSLDNISNIKTKLYKTEGIVGLKQFMLTQLDIHSIEKDLITKNETIEK